MDKKEARKLAKEQKAVRKAEREKKYRRAKTWQMALYPIGGFGHNAFMFLMGIVAYYATGIVGLGTVIASFIITGSRVLDGITDPLIGLIIDKTKGKYGKVRPTLLIAYVLMASSTLLMFFTNHLVPEAFSIFYFILLYAIFIFGYTCSQVGLQIGNNIITNDPEQRPVFGMLTMIYTMLFYTIATIYLSMYLTGKYGGYSEIGLFHEMTIFTVILAGVAYGVGIFAIAKKDRIENFGAGKNTVPLKLKDLWPILKGNRPLQMYIVAATTDKLSLQIHGNQIVNVMLFGIVIGNYSLMGTTQAIAMIPNILVLIFGMRYAMKFGSKKGYVGATWACLISYSLLFLLLWLGDPTQIRMDNLGFMTIAFLLLFLVGGAVRYVASGLSMPMLMDVIDYNTYQTERYAPGVISSVYSFIDKSVSSLQQTFVGLMLALIGFKSVFPDVDTPYSDKLFWMTMFLSFGVMMFAWIASLIAMKFYELDKDRMAEIEEAIEARRNEIIDDNSNIATK
ncbi:glucuronide permease [Aquibacillus halophilus]|uniref:Glucuronide permease n=1 Tax=Aquibacillus halophilus TaxID=930132 RepID=A0A6A8DHC7_9BACI|nr:MFS transporter [Aquibacillus halophilus]MRH45108.1 glucuronide permease [Aquibacillus halophilus]